MKYTKQQKISILIYCEGKTEVAFLKYIKSLFINGKIKTVRIKSEGGGSLSSIREIANRYKNYLKFDEVYIFMDGDKITPQDHLKTSDLISKPCIEGFFLKILQKTPPRTSSDCKKYFENNYLNSKEKLAHYSYEQIFTKEMLNQIRQIIPLLDKIIKIFE